jgi:hypothetical protein
MSMKRRSFLCSSAALAGVGMLGWANSRADQIHPHRVHAASLIHHPNQRACVSKVLHYPHVGTQIPVINCKMATVRGRYNPRRGGPAQPMSKRYVPRGNASFLLPEDVGVALQASDEDAGGASIRVLGQASELSRRWL